MADLLDGLSVADDSGLRLAPPDANGAAVSSAASTEDFRARGLAARRELSQLPLDDSDAPLFLGGDEVAGGRALLEEHRISHVCNATTQTPNHFPELFQYLRVDVLDARGVELRQKWLPAAVEFVSAARRSGTGVLVHCLWGVSRAPTLVCAYLVASGRTLRQALEIVSAARPAAQPNSAFMSQLIEYEASLKGAASLTLDEYKAACRYRTTASTALADLLASGLPGGRCMTVEGHTMFVQRVSQAPRIALIEGFLTAEEADAAVAAALESGLLHPSRTAPRKDGTSNTKTETNMPSLVSSGRTSSNCRLDRTHPVGAAALRRAAHLVGLTPRHAEALQVVHYDEAQKYNAHFDFFQAGLPGYERRMGTQGQRLVTCFVYLNDVAGGGCTYFPELKKRFSPRKGCAVLWYNMDREGGLDKKTLHAGEPVTSGEKWGMNIWLRERAKMV